MIKRDAFESPRFTPPATLITSLGGGLSPGPSPFLLLSVAFQKPNFDAIHRARRLDLGKSLAMMMMMMFASTYCGSSVYCVCSDLSSSTRPATIWKDAAAEGFGHSEDPVDLPSCLWCSFHLVAKTQRMIRAVISAAQALHLHPNGLFTK